MFAEIIFFPARASTTATQVDWLSLYLLAITGAVGVMVAVLLIGFSVVYRRRPGPFIPPPPMAGNKVLEGFWTITPLFFFLSFFVWGAYVYYNAYRAPNDATVIYAVGKQWMWKFQHPEGQREINALHVPVGQPFKLMFTSEDVIHSFFVPEFRIHMDVLPGRYTSTWFHATQPGVYHLFCSQYCGTAHAKMIGAVYVMEPTEYQRWLEYHAEGSMALNGRKVFLKYRCISCHTGNGQGRAPTLEELYGKPVVLSNGQTVRADEDYIRESILDPGAKIVAGYENIMPTFKGQIQPEEINELIAWLKTLGKGGTPDRVDQFPPPTSTPHINNTPKGKS